MPLISTLYLDVELFRKMQGPFSVLLSESLNFSRTFELYAEIFKKGRADHHFVPFECHPNDLERLESLIDVFRSNKNFISIMVSNPFKQKMMDYSADKSSDARLFGCTNLLTKERGSIFAHNLDGEAFALGMQHSEYKPKKEKLLVFGAGGVSTAVSFSLATKCEEIVVCDLFDGYSDLLMRRLSRKFPEIPVRATSIERANIDLENFTLVYNGTSLGKQGTPYENASPVLPGMTWNPKAHAIDANYTPERTTFLRHADMQNVGITNGLYHMLASTLLHTQILGAKGVSFTEVKRLYKHLPK